MTGPPEPVARTVGAALVIRAVAGLLGIVVIAYGAYLVFHGGSGSPPITLSLWVVALLIAHDAILVPLVALIGYVVTRFIPAYARTPVQIGLIVGGSVTLMSVAVLGAPGNPSNPSLLPYDYPVTLSIVLAIIIAATAGAVVLRVVKERRNPREET